MSPAGVASRWTWDKSHLLSRAQRQPVQMAWNKGLFCSSGRHAAAAAEAAVVLGHFEAAQGLHLFFGEHLDATARFLNDYFIYIPA